jgi:2'-5' RNA ligase
MLAIASLLDPTTDQQTKNLWRFLEDKCGLAGIKTTPYPHFSWLSCDDLNWAPVSKNLARIAINVKSFKASTAGLGIFSGSKPILYVSVVKTPELLDIHQKIWRKVRHHLVNPQDYYLPEYWMPHITIAQGDLTPANLSCALQDLAFVTMSFEIIINNISVIFNTPEGVGVKARFKLE